MYDKRFFRKNLKYLREKHHVEQQELAEELGRKSGSTVSDWERGKAVPNTGILTYIANKFGVSLTDLMETDLQGNTNSNNGQMHTKELAKHELIPILGEVAAGSPDFADENVIGYMTLPPDKKTNDGLFYLRVKSDSMDKLFPVGSYVLVDSQVRPENGDIAIVKPNGDEATLKRIKYQSDYILLIPESHNDEHETKIIDAKRMMQTGLGLEDFKVIGKVVGMYMDI